MTKVFVIPVSVGLALCACNGTEQKTSAPTTTAQTGTQVRQAALTADLAARETCPQQSDDAFFFPAASLAARNPRFDDDLFLRQWYSEHLRKMAEPSLSCGEAWRTYFVSPGFEASIHRSRFAFQSVENQLNLQQPK